jgi:integration host factor subunit alpha
MTKVDIVEKVFKKVGLSKNESEEMVEEVLELIKATLEGGENLKISGFGNFVVKKKADRKGRNPQTGEPITIEARKVLTFKPSPILKQAVNNDPASESSSTTLV